MKDGSASQGERADNMLILAMIRRETYEESGSQEEYQFWVCHHQKGEIDKLCVFCFDDLPNSLEEPIVKMWLIHKGNNVKIGFLGEYQFYVCHHC